MNKKSSPLTFFIIKVFLWLPLCYWGWYFFAEFTTLLAVSCTEPVLLPLYPKLLASIGQMGHLVEVVANVTVPTQEVPTGMIAELPIPVNPLIYSYGFPLSLALILSSPFHFSVTLRHIVICITLFLIIQVSGISFEALKILFLQTDPKLLGTPPPRWQLDIIALGYQLHVLVVPAVTPIILWVIFYYDFITQEIMQQNKK
jgi:hypothetical protein